MVEPKEPSAMLNIEQVVPADPKQPYDVRDVIRCIVDDSDFLEIQELWAANIVIGFGRMAGETKKRKLVYAPGEMENLILKKKDIDENAKEIEIKLEEI